MEISMTDGFAEIRKLISKNISDAKMFNSQRSMFNVQLLRVYLLGIGN